MKSKILKIILLFCLVLVYECNADSVPTPSKKERKTTDMELLLTGKKINISDSEILFEDDFHSDTLDENWISHGNAEWNVKNSSIYGKNKGGRHGQIFSRKTFSGNIIVEFEAETVLPSDHDIIWFWNTEIPPENPQLSGYLGCLAGFWRNKTGIEKAPDYKLFSITPLFEFEAGKKYFIQSGSINDHLFLFVDGKLIIELRDPSPFDNKKQTRVGFGVYQSNVKYSNLKVRKISWEAYPESY